MDRYILFNNLITLFETVDSQYKMISCNGVEVDILDIMISPLYLAAVQAQYGTNADTIPFRNLPVKKKISMFPKRVIERIEYSFQVRKGKNIANFNNTLSKADIIFLPVEPTHLLRQIPVARILAEKGIGFSFITNRINIYNELWHKGFNVFFMSMEMDSSTSATHDISELCDQIRKNNLKDSNPIVNEKVLDFIIIRFEYLLHKVLEVVGSIYKYINSMKPSVVVIGNDVTFEGRSTTKICQALGIATTSIMHGSVAGEPMDSLHIVDNFFLHGKLAKDYLINLGISAENLIVSGDPHIDRLKIMEKSCHPQIRRKLPIKNGQGYVLLALSGPGHCTSFEHFYKIVNSIVKFSAKNPDIDIIAKLHRKDNKNNYSNIKRRFPGNRLHVVENGRKGLPRSIYDWLSGCKLVITGASTVAIEAMLMKLPVITVDYMNEYQEVDFIDFGATIHVKTETELFEAIQNVLHSSNKYKDVMRKAQQYINTYFYKPNGRASERIADYLVQSV